MTIKNPANTDHFPPKTKIWSRNPLAPLISRSSQPFNLAIHSTLPILHFTWSDRNPLAPLISQKVECLGPYNTRLLSLMRSSTSPSAARGDHSLGAADVALRHISPNADPQDSTHTWPPCRTTAQIRPWTRWRVAPCALGAPWGPRELRQRRRRSHGGGDIDHGYAQKKPPLSVLLEENAMLILHGKRRRDYMMRRTRCRWSACSGGGAVLDRGWLTQQDQYGEAGAPHHNNKKGWLAISNYGTKLKI